MSSLNAPPLDDEDLNSADLAFLIAHGIPPDIISRAARTAEATGTSLEALLIATGVVTDDEFYRAVAGAAGVPWLPAPTVIVLAEPAVVLAAGVAPLAPGEDLRWVAAPSGRQIRLFLESAAQGIGALDGFAVTSPRRLERAVLASSGDVLAHQAAHRLPDEAPGQSFRDEARPWERLGMYALVGTASFWLTWMGREGIADLSTLVNAFILVGIAFRLGATAEAQWAPQGPAEPRLQWMRRWPTYSILVPLYGEAAMVARLTTALARLNYPPGKLEVLYLVEADDRETQAAFARLQLPSSHRIVRCPPGLPRTKPRALNIGLALAKGELVTIYDAEDAPAPDQLLKTAALFVDESPDFGCVQAALVPTSARGRLARMFRLEYAALYAAVLPGHARMGLPMPLGGTSNHFRRDALVAAGGWDAWNVTEDADLGLRFARLGYRVGMVASETAEHPPVTFRQWFPQRVRWYKGWLQTGLVASRHLRDQGLRTWSDRLAVVAHSWSTVLAALVAPAFAAALGLLLLGLLEAGDSPRERVIIAVHLVVLAAAVPAVLWPMLLGASRLGIRIRASDVAFGIVYMLLLSAAAWKAVWELLDDPHRWNKTDHTPEPLALAVASEHRFEFASRFGRRALKVEAADEAAPLVHQVDQRRVVHGVAAAVERHAPRIHAK